MKVVFTVADLQPESGGPTRSVVALADSVARQGIEVQLISLDYGHHGAAPMAPDEPVHVTLVPCRGVLARKLKWSRAFLPTLLGHCQPAAGLVLHDAGLWLPTNHAAAHAAWATRVPFIVSPRGMLTPWALRYRGWKKRLAWRLYQRRDLQQAKVLHATSHQEAAELRELKLIQPIAVVPNGVTLPPPHQPTASPLHRFTDPPLHRSTDPPLHRFTAPPSHRPTVLFLGRIHPIKGLMDLVKAWALIEQGKAESRKQKAGIGWRVVIAGGDEGGHLEEVKAETRKQKVEGDFEFVGPVDGAAKWDLYRSADLFVLPSKSENFGIVVAEALACGVPVITTRGTPWEELETHRCGWWVELGVEPLARALSEAIAMSDVERHEMGRRGRKLVEERYTWPAAAQKMVAVYRWMLGEGERPECVEVKSVNR